MSALDINDLIGKPWRRDGRGPDVYDCWGLTREILLRMQPDAVLPDWLIDTMTRERQREIMAGASEVYGERIDAAEHGALLLLLRAAHIAIVVDGWVITTRRKTGAVAVRVHEYLARYPGSEAYRWRA
jgi:hypothetical protein